MLRRASPRTWFWFLQENERDGRVARLKVRQEHTKGVTILVPGRFNNPTKDTIPWPILGVNILVHASRRKTHLTMRVRAAFMVVEDISG